LQFNPIIAETANNEIVLSEEQQIAVSGKVSDENGEPLIGVSIMIEGTTLGVVTDINGNYSINASDTDVLVFQYVGMQNQRILVGNKKTIDVILIEDSTLIDELVVIGYGTVKKSNVSGALSTVSAKDLKKLPAANLSQALQG